MVLDGAEDGTSAGHLANALFALISVRCWSAGILGQGNRRYGKVDGGLKPAGRRANKLLRLVRERIHRKNRRPFGGPTTRLDGDVGAVRNWSILLGGLWTKGTRRDRVDFSPEERTLRVRLIGPALRHFYDDKYLVGRCLDLHALRKTNVRYSEASQGYAVAKGGVLRCVSGDRKSGLNFPR